MLLQNCLGGTEQCRGRDCPEGRKLSWLQKFYYMQWASPGAALIPDLSW